MLTNTKLFLIFLFLLTCITSVFILNSLKKNTDDLSSSTVLYPKKIKVIEKTNPASLLFVGDIMLDRTIRKDGEKYGYENLFSCLKAEFNKYDEVIGNLEGTITENISVSRDAEFLSPESYSFTFDKKAVLALVDIGLSIVSIGNNHIQDFGDKGIDQTIQTAFDMQLGVFGDPRSNKQRYFIKDIKGNRIAFIPYNQFFGTTEEVFKDLENTKEISDIQIIFAHWGDEYVPVQKEIRDIAHTFVTQGADLIIGSHPHVIQEYETYKGIKIYYSLGNFIFDQYWEKSVQEGLAVTVFIENKSIFSTQELMTESVRYKGTCFKKPPTH